MAITKQRRVSSRGKTPSYRAGNTPLYSLGAAVALITLAVIVLITVPLDAQHTPLALTVIGLIVSTVPSLIAAAFSERASRDIRNGVLTEKVKEGAGQAVLDPDTVARLVEMLEPHLNGNGDKDNG